VVCSAEMATLFGQPMDIGSDKHSIVDDFMYGSSVASSHVYIRLGMFYVIYAYLVSLLLLECFDTVGLVTGRATGLY